MPLDTATAEQLIRMELKQWGFPPDAFEWVDENKVPGAIAFVYAGENKIHFTEKVLKSSALLTEVVKHEIAHLLSFQERGVTRVTRGMKHHCANWRKWCGIVGCRPRTIIPV